MDIPTDVDHNQREQVQIQDELVVQPIMSGVGARGQ